MDRLAILTLLLAFLCMPCAAAPAVEDTMREVPFSFEKGFVLVRAKIKGALPVEVVLATGAEHSIVDDGLLDKYKLPGYYSAEQPITGSHDRLYSFTIVPDISVGDVKETSLSMRLGSMAGVSQIIGREIFGIFGADFFKGRVVQFDFKKKMVRFLHKSLTDANGRVELPMSFYKDEVTLPIVENVTFDGKKIKTLLNTGIVAVIFLSPSATKQLGLQPPPEKAAPLAHKVKSLRFNNYELNDIPVLLFAKGTFFDTEFKKSGAVVGTILLQNFVVTFDYRKKVVILEHI